jgi:hypothetical protein
MRRQPQRSLSDPAPLRLLGQCRSQHGELSAALATFRALSSALAPSCSRSAWSRGSGT